MFSFGFYVFLVTTETFKKKKWNGLICRINIYCLSASPTLTAVAMTTSLPAVHLQPNASTTAQKKKTIINDQKVKY